MKDYIGHLLMVLGVVALVACLGIYRRSQTRKPEPDKKKGVEVKKKGVEVVCKTCNGTGETEQDVNLLMAKATYAIWHNSHSRNCEECKRFPDGEPCETDGKKFKEIMDKYEKAGSKIDKAACPDCMGMGKYTQYDGYRFGKERE